MAARFSEVHRASERVNYHGMRDRSGGTYISTDVQLDN